MSATDTVMYFKKDLADLTPDDRTHLDSYAAKYVAAGSTDQVTVTGWASMEGNKKDNETLAEKRAKAVADYLASKGISKIKPVGSGPTDKFGSDLKANRCATVEPKPPAPASPGATSSPAPARPLKSPDELYKLGHEDGLNGAPLICPADADADGEEAFNRGYADGMRERMKSGALAKIQSDLKLHDDEDLEKQINSLSDLSMDDILDVMQDLKNAGQLDNFADHVGSEHHVIGVAILTINKDFDQTWQDLVSKLGGPAREAVLKRVPPGTYTPPTGPGKSGGPPDDDGSPVTVGVMFVPQTFHQAANNPSDKSTDPPAVQVQGQYTFKFHRDGQAGFEFSPVAQAQFMWDPDKKQLITQPMLGGQGALVQFLTKTIQLQEFAQLLGGATLEIGKGIGKTVSLKPLATGQVALGVQAVFSLGGKHLQLVIQGQASKTNTAGAVTVDQSYGLGLQWNF